MVCPPFFFFPSLFFSLFIKKKNFLFPHLPPFFPIGELRAIHETTRSFHSRFSSLLGEPPVVPPLSASDGLFFLVKKKGERVCKGEEKRGEILIFSFLIFSPLFFRCLFVSFHFSSKQSSRIFVHNLLSIVVFFDFLWRFFSQCFPPLPFSLSLSLSHSFPLGHSLNKR